MIVQRLLRFALGPSYVENVDKEDPQVIELYKARKENAERSSVATAAESKALDSVSLQHKKKRNDGSLGEMALTGAYHLSYTFIDWPFYMLRTRVQTFHMGHSSYIGLFKGAFHGGREVGAGIVASGVHELATQLTDEVAASLKLGSVSKLLMRTGVWFLAFPFKEYYLLQILGVIPATPVLPPFAVFKRVFSSYYWQRRVTCVVDALVSTLFAKKVKSFTWGLLTYFSLKQVGDKPLVRLVSTHVLITVGDLLADFLCMGASSFSLRALALLSPMASETLRMGQLCNLRLLGKACLVEWTVSCVVAWSFSHVCRWYYRDQVK